MDSVVNSLVCSGLNIFVRFANPDNLGNLPPAFGEE